MKKIYFAVVALALLGACSSKEPPTIEPIDTGVIVSGNRSFYDTRLTTVTVDGIRCISSQSARGTALSCDWSK